MVRNNDRVPVYGSFRVLVTFITAFVRRIMPEPLCLWGLQLTGPVRQSASTHMGWRGCWRLCRGRLVPIAIALWVACESQGLLVVTAWEISHIQPIVRDWGYRLEKYRSLSSVRGADPCPTRRYSNSPWPGHTMVNRGNFPFIFLDLTVLAIFPESAPFLPCVYHVAPPPFLLPTLSPSLPAIGHNNLHKLTSLSPLVEKPASTTTLSLLLTCANTLYSTC